MQNAIHHVTNSWVGKEWELGEDSFGKGLIPSGGMNEEVGWN